MKKGMVEIKKDNMEGNYEKRKRVRWKKIDEVKENEEKIED